MQGTETLIRQMGLPYMMITPCFCVWCLFSWLSPMPELALGLVDGDNGFNPDNLHYLIFKTVCLGFPGAHSLLNGSSLDLGDYCSFSAPV